MTESDQTIPVEKTSNMALLLEIITAPSSAFETIWQKGASWLLPLVVVLVASSLMWAFYFTQVDVEWFMSQATAGLEGEGQRQAAREAPNMSPNFLVGMTVGATVVGLIVINLILAVYLLLINRVTGTTSRSYKEWFTIAVWTGIPAIFLALGGIINILISGSANIPPELISLTNLNGLIFHASKSNGLYGLYSSLDIITFWSFALLVLALIKNGQHRITAIAIAGIPTVLMSILTIVSL